jgi:hypothetical protein
VIDLEDVVARHLADRATQAVPLDQFEAIVHGGPMLRSAHSAKRRGLAWWLAAAAVVAAVVTGVALVARRGDPPAPASRPAIDWSSRSTLFTMDEFAIEAGGRRFVGASDDRDINGFVDDEYGIIELTWREFDIEMRLNISFARSATEWWVTDVSTYDGSQDGEWLYAIGERFRRPIGQAYVGDVTIDVTAEPSAPNAGAIGRVTIAGATLLPFTTVDIPDPAPLFNGEPPPLPEGIPGTGVQWTTRGSYALETALRVGQQDCMRRQGFEFELMAEQLEIGVGVWQPDVVLGVLTERGAREQGYHTFGDPVTDPGPAEVATSGMSQAESDAYYSALVGDDVAVPPTNPDGSPNEGINWRGCMGEAAAAFDGLVNDQEILRQYVSESGIDQAAVAESAAADRRVRAALASWSSCVADATGEVAETPDELARRFALSEQPPTEREREVAVADVRCQGAADLQDVWHRAYAEYQRAVLDQPERFDELALMRVEIVARAEQILAERGLPIPEFD